MKSQHPPWYRWEGDELVLFLRVQPRANRDEFLAPHGDRYKVRITAAPVEGKANAHLLRFLAKSFGVNKGQVSLVSGEHGKNKGVRIRSPQRMPIPVNSN
jgi:uncharacterized protein (TIGR00251 family)